MAIADRVLRRLQAGHVGCHRAPELAALLTGAGLTELTMRSLLHGFYAILAARKPG
jgi:hypothetical protein